MTPFSFKDFHPAVAEWFEKTLGKPTPPQIYGWPAIAAGHNVLLLAPTGSGKTLAAFLKCLDTLYRSPEPLQGVQVLYISPLKALNNDINRNLEVPLAGIAQAAARRGVKLPEIRTAVRSGDTPAKERQRMLRHPPQILITTPESFYLMLSSKAREILRTVRYVIVDEIHTLYPNKRGAHLSLSLERLEYITNRKQPLQRIGLSATMRPLSEAAAFLGGGGEKPRPVQIIDTGQRKQLDVSITLPVPNLRLLPENTIWPSIYQCILDFVRTHRTTLVFVNNRRQAERITSQLNQLAGREIARTHHGSVSKELRLQSEEMLKTGQIPCMVATSSLELGIDVGYIDLVLQIESPKEVARGLQRVGRAGHVHHLASKGRIIPKTLPDLLEAVVVLQEMRQGQVEETRAPQNCLDVLAQQITAMTCQKDWERREMYQIITSSYCYRDLSEKRFNSVLAMLSGNYRDEQFYDLKPRIFWDRQDDMVRSDPYGKRLVYSNSGTIPDRGYFAVYLKGTETRIGELDEEFVFESRPGHTFVLGTSVWRVEEIRQDRVLVSAAGSSEQIPFWKGENEGRPFLLGQKIGRFIAGLLASSGGASLARTIQEQVEIDKLSATNLGRYLESQRASGAELPTDRRLVLEYFLDEASEGRAVLHSFFGFRTNSLLALLIKHYWQQHWNWETEAVVSDDGIMFHCPAHRHPPQIDWSKLPQGRLLQENIAELVSETPIFGVFFRQAAQRSLVMASGLGAKRTPLWLARLKAGSLLQTVSMHRDFPLIWETYREILHDYFELEHLQRLLKDLQTGQAFIDYRETTHPSPFAQNHMLGFVAAFMYETDGPRGEKKAQLFGLGRQALNELLGSSGWREILSKEAITAVEEEVQGFDRLKRNPSIDRLLFHLERVGDALYSQLADICPDQLEQALSSGKAGVWPTGSQRLVVYSPAMAGYETRDWGPVIKRYILTHGPFTAEALAQRYALTTDTVNEILLGLEQLGLVEKGDFLPGGQGEEWCSSAILERIHRRSLQVNRARIKPQPLTQFSSFLVQWQGLQPKQKGLDGLVKVLRRLQGLWLPAQLWEGAILPQRISDYCPSMLNQLTASGQLAWQAKGTPANLQVCFDLLWNDDEPELEPLSSWEEEEIVFRQAAPSALSKQAKALIELLEDKGALTLVQLSRETGQSTARLWPVLEELVAAGRVTNDSFGPVRLLTSSSQRQRNDPKFLLRASTLAELGRWSLIEPPKKLRAGTAVQQLLNRYGIVCREMAQAENLPWGPLYRLLTQLESVGRVFRGLFVSDFNNVQFALPTAVDMLRGSEPDLNSSPVVLFKDDPANVGRFSKTGLPDIVVVYRGETILTAQQRNLKISTPLDLDQSLLREALVQLCQALFPFYPDQKIHIQEFNGNPAHCSAVTSLLQELGWEKDYRGLTLWPSQRAQVKAANQDV